MDRGSLADDLLVSATQQNVVTAARASTGQVHKRPSALNPEPACRTLSLRGGLQPQVTMKSWFRLWNPCGPTALREIARTASGNVVRLNLLCAPLPLLLFYTAVNGSSEPPCICAAVAITSILNGTLQTFKLLKSTPDDRPHLRRRHHLLSRSSGAKPWRTRCRRRCCPAAISRRMLASPPPR